MNTSAAKEFFDSSHKSAVFQQYGQVMQSPKIDAARLMTLRKQIREIIPFCETFVTYDVMLLIIAADDAGIAINIKAINALLPHSASYMRQIFRTLENDDMIKMNRDPADKRNVVVKPSEKMRAAFGAYCRRAEDALFNEDAADLFDVRKALAELD